MSEESKPLEGELVNQGEIVQDATEYNLTIAEKIYEAFRWHYNITEACQHAGISRGTYYNWLEQHPQFAEKVEVAKTDPLKQAKQNIAKEIQGGDVSTSKWLLERRDPDFKPKAEVDNTHEVTETRKKIGDFLDDTGTTTSAPVDSPDGDSGAAGDQPNDAGAEPAGTDAEAGADPVAATPPDIS